METPVVVLDEPTTGLDAREIARVEAIAVGLAEMGRTIVTISHDMRFVAETAARVVVMREGLIVADGRPADVFAEETWPTLRSSHLEPTYCARVGARLGLGSTPTDRDVVRALRARPAREPT
jgi:energy-coupling factor transport system ATP-binding protein